MTASADLAPLLAEARRHHLAGDLAAARPLYEAYLRDLPDDPVALSLAGTLHHQTGDHARAVAMIERALELDPDLGSAWQNIVPALLALGRSAAAVQAGERAVAATPGSAGAHVNLALARSTVRDLEGAASAALTALELRPDDVRALSILAEVRGKQGSEAEATALYQQALRLDPRDLEARYNYGVHCQATARMAEAIEQYRATLEIDPRHEGARVNLGAALRDLGRIDEALAVWRAGLEVAPDSAPLRYNLACGLLAKHRWPEAVAGYELRWIVRDLVKPFHGRADIEEWDGTPLREGTLLVHHEQGLGDTLQFFRLLPLLRSRVGRLTFVCQPQLLRLLQSSPVFSDTERCAIELLPEGAALPPARHWLPLLSIPHRLGSTHGDLPPWRPSLRAEPERVAKWAELVRNEIGDQSGMRVGLAWQGNPLAPAERGRSVPLDRLSPLGQLPGLTLVCLQKGHGREQLVGVGDTLPMVDLDTVLDQGDQAFLDTAALIAGLDLVITSDTSMAHLAGALGGPVWVLLKHSPDWRWGVEGALTPWYPTMRLFRQPAPGDWDGVVSEVEAELRRLLTLREEIAASSPAEDDIEAAIELHRRGDLAAARSHYLSLLHGAPDQADPLDLLAMASFALDRQNLPMALAASSRATSLRPTSPETFANFAVLLKEAGRHLDAETALRHALRLHPGHPAATQNLANLLIATDRAAETIGLVEAALAQAPGHPDLLSALARALRGAGRLAEARAVLRGALGRHAERADLWLSLAAAASEAKDYGEAEIACYRALERNPEDADALNNLGVIARNCGEEPLAIWFYRRALRRNPRSAEYWGNLGVACGEVGDHAEARRAYEQAVELRPDYAEAHLSLGMSFLADGDCERGLPHYEWRLRVPKLGYRAALPRLPMWQGEPLAGKRILLLTEQGFGDTIQFVRYAARLKERGAAKVTVGCRTRIAALIRTATEVDEVLIEGQSLPGDVDCQAHLLSLPLLTGTRLEDVPARVPYLRAEPERVLRWARWLAQGTGFRIGLSWQGNPDPGVDTGRSMPLAELLPLAGLAGTRLVSLQHGHGSEQIAPLADRLPIERPGPDFDADADAFLDTAALMMSLDLIVTTDTAVAHLAGALGRPAWLLLKAQPEWRWLKQREDNPWYPTMRLFRQTVETEIETGTSKWAPVVARLTEEARHLVTGDRRRLVAGRSRLASTIGDVARAPTMAEILARHQHGDLATARAGYARILATDPDQALAVHYLGVVAHQQGMAERALHLLQWARARGVDEPDHDTNLAVALKALGRLDEAESLLRAVLERSPRHGEALLVLANLSRDRDRPEEALELIEKARAALPGHPKVQRAMGNILRDLGRLPLAVTALEAALRAEPDDAETGIDLAHALLASGDLVAGFAAYEWRWKSGQMACPPVTSPAWQGQPLHGERLLILGEQGLGDIIQAARFLAPLAERVGEVIIAVRPALVALLRHLVPPARGSLRIVPETELPAHDMHASLFSLPSLLRLDRSQFRKLGKPYLQPDPDRLLAWRQRLGQDRRLTVGLVWQGNPVAKADRGRSPPLATLAPLLGLDGIRFVALQKEHGLDQLAGSPLAERIEVLVPELDRGPDGFLDTGAVMTLTDLVVTSDTAAAHLAGALGLPTWLMLKAAPDWRWGVGHRHSVWYPSFRLFRQPRPGDWPSVAMRMAVALAKARDTQSVGLPSVAEPALAGAG